LRCQARREVPLITNALPSLDLRERLAGSEMFRGAPDEVVSLCCDEARTFGVVPGELLLRAGERSTSLFLVLQGRVRVLLPGTPTPTTLAEIGVGDVVGEVQAVTGLAAEVDAVAVGACTVLELGRELRRAIGTRFEAFDARLAQLATRRLRALIFRRTVAELVPGLDAAPLDALVSAATEVVLERSACLMAQGDVADAWYVLTSGRLSVVTESADGPRPGADLLPGASVGEIGLIAGGIRSATVVAERDASLIRLSRDDFERFADLHPDFAWRLMGTVVRRLVGQMAARPARGAQVMVVLRASASPRLQAALEQLGTALQRTVAAALCTRKGFEAAVGRTIDGAAAPGPAHPLWSQFDLWLAESQNAHEVVLLDAGVADDLWARECVLHADRCLWLAEPVAPGSSVPPAAAHERLRQARRPVEQGSRGLTWALLLAHPASADMPRDTRAWLGAAPFDRHFHLRVDDARTMERAARLLAGRGLGLALSGGGARGLAHIGVIDAFAVAGIPIDCIGGTSIGAIQAGMYAMGLSTAEMVELNRYVIGRRPFQEYTLPVIALVASRRRDACIRKSFGDVLIEDLWIPYLAVSTDLHSAQARVHESGSLGLAASASSSIPGILVPVTEGPRVLVDGGVVNNLPADLVKSRCGGTVFASKVAPSDDVRAPEGGFPSPWAVLWHRLLPWFAPLRTPKLGDLLIRTMTVGGEDHMQRVARQADVLIEPEVDRYGMLQFSALEALVECGSLAARRCLAEWVASRR
jgi:predicted acylesterase/phospholipase RssA/CRP-like cAMP-binding protein